jgi:hypothetical protein
VASALFDLASSPVILALADRLTDDAEAELGRIITILRLNPWPDGVVRFSLRLDDSDVIVYNDGEWNVIYRITERTLQLLDAWETQS